jgi:hypothetical protein
MKSRKKPHAKVKIAKDPIKSIHKVNSHKHIFQRRNKKSKATSIYSEEWAGEKLERF